MFHSVRARFTALHLGLIFFLALPFGIFSYTLILDALHKSQKSNLEYIVATEAEHLSSIILHKEELLLKISQDEIVTRYTRSYQDKVMNEYFYQFKAEFPILSFVNKAGFEEFKIDNGAISHDLQDVSGSSLYQDMNLRVNKVFTTLTSSSNPNNGPLLEMGYYRQNFFGDFEGIIIGRIPLAGLLTDLHHIDIGESGFFMLLDERGLVLDHPQSWTVLQPIESSSIESERIIQQALGFESGFGRATLQGIDAYVAFAPVSYRNWVLIASLPYDEFITAAEKLRNTFVLILLIILIAGFIIFHKMTSAITKPILNLTHSSDRLAQGDLSQRVELISDDEIGVLGRSFNLMAGNLQQAENKLLDTVKEKEAVADNLLKSQIELQHEAELRESLIDELESKNAELERFTYTVSHDLKSPLVTVKGFIGLLKKDIQQSSSEAVDSDLQHIADATDKMAILLDDLLELSRIGRVVNKPQFIPLTEIFEEVLPLIHGQIQQTRANITIQSNMPTIFADRQRMIEVAQNLLDNAMKFSKQDVAPEISVRATIDADHIICCVKDNGIGIRQEYQDKIFGLFDRLDHAYDGTGIGLSLVKRIIDVHNGSLTVESDGDGKGAIFCFSLPVVHQEN